MIALHGVLLRAETRGFIINVDGQEHYRPPRHARRQLWFSTLPAEDRETVSAWLRLWALQKWRGRRRSRSTGRPRP